MKNIELKDLIVPLLAIILFASSIGKLGQLHTFSRTQAVKAVHGWKPHHFFPSGYGKIGAKSIDI